MTSGDMYPVPEHHGYLDEQVSELHASLFNRLISGERMVVAWQSQDEQFSYAAINLVDPLKNYVNHRSPHNAYQSISSSWQFIRYGEPDMNNVRPAKTFSTHFEYTGLVLHVLQHDGMPADIDDTPTFAEWVAAVDNCVELENQVGLTEPTEVDFAEFENAMRDLRTWNNQHGLDRGAFETIKRQRSEWGMRFSHEV